MVKEALIVVIKTGDDYSYYLVKLNCDLNIESADEKGNCNHKFPVNHKAIKGQYLDNK